VVEEDERAGGAGGGWFALAGTGLLDDIELIMFISPYHALLTVIHIGCLLLRFEPYFR